MTPPAIPSPPKPMPRPPPGNPPPRRSSTCDSSARSSSSNLTERAYPVAGSAHENRSDRETEMACGRRAGERRRPRRRQPHRIAEVEVSKAGLVRLFGGRAHQHIVISVAVDVAGAGDRTAEPGGRSVGADERCGGRGGESRRAAEIDVRPAGGTADATVGTSHLDDLRIGPDDQVGVAVSVDVTGACDQATEQSTRAVRTVQRNVR